MEVERRTMRQRQLHARDMLRGDLEGEELERHVEERVVMTSFESASSMRFVPVTDAS